jgi:hypothetical protein
LNVIAHFRQLGRRAYKIWHRARVAIPNEDVKALPTQIIGDPGPDYSESDYANIFSRSTRHAMEAALWPLLSLRRKTGWRNAEVSPVPRWRDYLKANSER